jgi:hypothetical protein
VVLNPRGQEDLLNTAAVETLRHGGSVYTIPPGQAMSSPVAAIFRY